MSDAKAAIDCINLFNLHVTVMILGKLFIALVKRCGGPSLSFWPRLYLFISNEHDVLQPIDIVNLRVTVIALHNPLTLLIQDHHYCSLSTNQSISQSNNQSFISNTQLQY